MKKTLSMILAFVMVATLALTVMPMSAFATTGTYTGDDAARTAGMYFRIGALDAENGNTYTATFNEAVTAAKEAGDGTVIYMIQDYTTSDTLNFSATDSFKNLTVNGGGYTFKHTASGYAFDITNMTKVIFENFKKIDLVRAIRSNNSSFEFIDVETITASERPSIWMLNVAGSSVSLVLKNTTVVSNASICESARRLGVDSGGTTSYTFEMVNSGIKYAGKATSANNHNCSALGITTASKVDVVIDGDSWIETAHSTGTNTAYAICVYASTPTTITLKAGAKLIQSGTSTNVGFIGPQVATVTDEGCEYIVKSTAANGTVTFPSVDGKKFVSGSTSVVSGGAYTKTDAQTADMTFKIADATAITNDAEAVANGMFFRVGDVSEKQYAANLAAAVTAAEEGDTVYLLANGYTHTAALVFNKKNITLDGQGFTMAMTVGYGFDVRATGFKLHNITVDATGQIFSISPAPADTEFLLTVDNADLYSDGGIIINYNHKRNGTVTTATTCKLVISDSSLIGDTTNFEDVILLNNDANFDVDIKNSTLKVANSKSATTWGRVIAIGQTITGSVDVDIANSTLETAYNSKSQIISVIGASTTTDITLDASTKLVLSAEASTDVYAEFIFVKTDSKTTINDNGASYIASASVIKAATDGVALPAVAAEGKTVLGYKSGDALYGTNYKNAETTEAMTFTAAIMGANAFDIETGASIRTSSPYGIRFSAVINAELLNALGQNAEFGMVITPYANAFNQEAFVNIGELSSDKYAKVVGENLKDITVDGVATKQLLAAVYMKDDEGLTTVGKTQFETKMAACAYLTVTYADGTSTTFWADYSGSDNARSLYEVAKAYYEDATITDGSNKSNATINNILTTCGYTLGA